MTIASFMFLFCHSNLPVSLLFQEEAREDLARASKTLIVTLRKGGKAGPGSL